MDLDGLLLIGGLCLVLVSITQIAISGVKNLRRRRRIIATPTSRIVDTPGNAPVEIKGRILPGEEGVLTAPFSGREAVWVRVIIEELLQRTSASKAYWLKTSNTTDHRPFLVDDGSGPPARVLTQGANVILDIPGAPTRVNLQDASPQLQSFLAARSRMSAGRLRKGVRYEEHVLAVGDELYAMGPSRRDPGPPVNDGYRLAPSTQLVLFAGSGADGELILSNKTEKQLVAKLWWSFVGGVVAGVVGLAFLAYFYFTYSE
jgi:hypothetical protein